MHFRGTLLILWCLMGTSLYAQMVKVQGKITTTKLEPLAFVSVQVKDMRKGTITKEDGTYELNLEPGKYDLIVSMIGYTSQVIPLVVNSDYVQNIILEEDNSKSLDEVIIRAKSKDKAEEIIRAVIQHKEDIVAAAGAYSCNVYIKAVQQTANTSERIITQKQVAEVVDSFNHMAMAEISLRLDYQSENRRKEERLGIKSNGKATGLYYLSTTEGTFNFYNNLVSVPSLSVTPFLSPISYSGLMAYKFKTIKIERKGNHKIYTISVKPRQLSNATVQGEVTISDSAWVLLHTHFSFPEYHLVEYDSFEIDQQYSLIDNKAWLITRQQFTYSSKWRKHKLSGQTTALYTNYELNKQFDKRYFGTELSATTGEAYAKDSTFWNTVRTEPLSSKEIHFIQYKDSLYRATHTAAYLDSIDRLTNAITWKKVGFLGQTLYNRTKQRTWSLPPVVSLYQPIAFGGTRITPRVYYGKTFPSHKAVSVFANLSYGLRNNDLNGSVYINRLYNPFHRGLLTISAGREFDFIYAGDAWINMIKRSNVYLNNHFSIGNDYELVNGLFLYTDLEMALRRSVKNYKTGNLVDSVLGDVLDNNQAVYFEPYNALYSKVELRYTFKQPYIREPKEKIYLPSKWPTVFVLWKKGLPGILNSKINFDYLEYGLEQQVAVGLLGNMRYKIKTGSFLNTKDIRLVDYQYQRRGDPWLFLNPDEAFQALDSTFPLFKRFYAGHMVHEFNGFFLNKIPLLKKLELREVAGAGFLIAPERHLRYAEAFAGIERVFKWPFQPMAKFKLGIYTVGSIANQFKNPVQFKVSFTTWDLQRNKWK